MWEYTVYLWLVRNVSLTSFLCKIWIITVYSRYLLKPSTVTSFSANLPILFIPKSVSVLVTTEYISWLITPSMPWINCGMGNVLWVDFDSITSLTKVELSCRFIYKEGYFWILTCGLVRACAWLMNYIELGVVFFLFSMLKLHEHITVQ